MSKITIDIIDGEIMELAQEMHDGKISICVGITDDGDEFLDYRYALNIPPADFALLMQRYVDYLKTGEFVTYDIPRENGGIIKNRIQEIKKGDSFFALGSLRIAKYDAHQNFDESDEPWIVYDNYDNSYFEEDVCAISNGGADGLRT